MSMTLFGTSAIALSVALVAYTYVGYPLMLRLLSFARGQEREHDVEHVAEWPEISITVPMYNEESQAAELIESLLALDYPSNKRQIVIVSDASTDRTDEIVRGYASHGVELFRLPERVGKTAAENAASERMTGEIIVNTDASIRIQPDALKPLVAPFQDPAVGLTSGRDLSVSRGDENANVGESGYVGYEMWVRDLETAVSGIVGSSGCLYATRRELHQIPVPDSLSRDFAAALKCAEHRYRAVSVPEAICIVPRTTSPRREYRRKVRTITRGMGTLAAWKRLLNPFRHGLFAWKLLSHKVFRWAVPWAGVLGVLGLALLAPEYAWALGFLVASVGGIVVGSLGWRLGEERPLPLPVELLAFTVMGNVAAMHATLLAFRGARNAIWEPTRRERMVAAD